MVSDGGTRHVKRRRRKDDGTYSASESYHSGDSNMFEKKKKKQPRVHDSGSEYSYYRSVHIIKKQTF